MRKSISRLEIMARGIAFLGVLSAFVLVFQSVGSGSAAVLLWSAVQAFGVAMASLSWWALVSAFTATGNASPS